MAAVFLGVTEWAVFDDVISHGAPITVKHAFLQAALLGTVYCGHMMSVQLRVKRRGSAFGCVLGFVIGTSILWTMCLSRNSEIEETKNNGARNHNAARANAGRASERAEKVLEDAHKQTLTALTAQSKAASAKTAACQWPKSQRCAEAKTDADKADAMVTAAQATEKRAEDAYYLQIARRDDMAPEKVEDGSIKTLVNILVAMPYVTVSHEQMEARVRMYMQASVTFFSELGFLVTCAIRTVRSPRSRRPVRPWAAMLRRRTVRIEAEPTELKALPGPKAGRSTDEDGGVGAFTPKAPVPRAPRGKMSKAEAEAYVVTEAALGRGVYGQDALAEACGVSPSTMHEWLQDWKARHIIVTTKVGKRNVISAKAPA
jgi:hypothetical protein